MPDQDPFNQEQNNQNTGDPSASQIDPFADQLSAIKNDQGEQKYGSVAEALKALNASQQHIKTLESEKRQDREQLEQARAELARMGSIDDFVKKISPTAAPTETQETPVVAEGLSEEKVMKMVQDRLEAQSAQAKAEQNLSLVVDKLSSVYGDKTSEHIAAKAAELQTTPAALREMAKSNPSMALTLLGGVPASSSSAPSQSTTIPKLTPPDNNPKPVIERGIARGGYTNKELVDMFRQSKAYTDKRLGLDT